MPATAKKFPAKRSPSHVRATRNRAAKKAEEAAKVLHSLAGSLMELDVLASDNRKPIPTPRNWWKLQAGRFKNDPTFADFVAQVQASRRQEG